MSGIKVKINQGTVAGCEEFLPNGRKFFRFSGIRYAKPPVGELRFQPPQKLSRFENDELDCSEERDACFHKSTSTHQYVGSEDCLNLNVYVPESRTTEKFAVMIYIHGGAFKYDSNSRQLHSPEYLLMEDVIVVIINYRLHVLGFLTMPSMGIAGNNGLKDQQMALEWVHENISHFNGDPNKICLFGESGGAGCTHLHVLNKKSRRFFTNAICQSGTALADWIFKGNSEDCAIKLAECLGHKSHSREEIYKFLLSSSVSDLYDNCEKVLTQSDIESGLKNKFRVVIEEDSEHAFLTQHPIDLIATEKIEKSIIFGTNDGDGMPATAKIRKNLKAVQQDLTKLIPITVKINRNSEAAKCLAEQIARFYFGKRGISEETIPELIMLMTDITYLMTQTMANEMHAKIHPNIKQFLYEFQFDGRLNILKKMTKMDKYAGACHGDDVFYIFDAPIHNIKVPHYSRESKMREMMCKLWTNFAKFNDPTPDHNNPLSFKWNPVEVTMKSVKSEVDLNYLLLNDECKIVKNLHQHRLDFWRNIYKSWNDKFLAAKL